MHVPAPLSLYCPTLHGTAVAFDAPAGQAYPGAHSPLHWLVVAPPEVLNVPGGHGEHTAAPPTLYVPTAHGAVHRELDIPDETPNTPAGHAVHVDAPDSEYWPGAQGNGWGWTDPAGHQ